MSKTCKKCGAELEDDDIFCDECGTRQTSEEAGMANDASKHLSQAKPAEKEDKKKQSGIGKASLVMGIISVVTLGVFLLPEILGIIFGILGRRDKTKDNGMATAGFVLSLISIFIVLIIIIIAVVNYI